MAVVSLEHDEYTIDGGVSATLNRNLIRESITLRITKDKDGLKLHRIDAFKNE